MATWTDAQTKESPLLTIPEVAAYLRVSRSYAHSIVRRGDIASVHLGKRVLVARIVLEAWVRQHTETARVKPIPVGSDREFQRRVVDIAIKAQAERAERQEG